MNASTFALHGARARGAHALVARVASPHLTLSGFVALAAMLIATQWNDAVSSVWLVAPLGLLWFNLLAAMATHRTLRRGGLGLFHFALLVGLLGVALGRLLHFDGRVEVTEGGLLDGAAIEVTSRGPWHGDAWRTLRFEQGAVAVDYAPALKRAATVSTVVRPDGALARVGDTVPLVLDGYRFYTTHNKGYAALIAFAPPGAVPERGALHMPSYPLFDWKQEQSWRAPNGSALRFWLRPDAPAAADTRWRFDPSQAQATLVVEVDGKRSELRAGDAIDGAFGRLRYERVVGWMGYRISHDATLLPLFWCAAIGLAGLAWHLLVARSRRTARAEDAR